MATTRRPAHLPIPDDETRPFWDACREHRLLLRHCRACDTVSYYPRPFCPACWSDNVDWVEASGRGTLYTWSIVHRNDLSPFDERLPYVAAIVDLEEGPRMMSNVIDVDHHHLRIGMDLVVEFHHETDDVVLPLFRPAP